MDVVDPLSTVDANLLPSLQALLEERNLTRAGARIMLTPQSMSGALTRLRRHFGDELLTRNGRDFELTEFAGELRPIVAKAVESAARILENRPFNPALSDRTFSICLSDYAMTVVAQPLTNAIRAASTSINLALEPLPAEVDLLSAALLRRDLLIAPAGYGVPGQRQPLFTDEFVCIAARQIAAAANYQLTLDDLRRKPFAVSKTAGPATTQVTPDELVLRRSGVRRNVLIDVPGLLMLPFAVSSTDLYAFVPRRLAIRCIDLLDIAIVDTPLPRVEIIEAAYWYPQRKNESALSWLRTVLHDVAVTLEAGG